MLSNKPTDSDVMEVVTQLKDAPILKGGTNLEDWTDVINVDKIETAIETWKSAFSILYIVETQHKTCTSKIEKLLFFISKKINYFSS